MTNDRLKTMLNSWDDMIRSHPILSMLLDDEEYDPDEDEGDYE